MNREKRKNNRVALISAALLITLCFFFSAANAVSAEELTALETKKVCMVTNALFDRDMIPVEFEGKTYYGCCKMCAGKIQNNESVRFSVDPFNGNKVDKALAFIIEGNGSEGEVLYFESKETAEKFVASLN